MSMDHDVAIDCREHYAPTTKMVLTVERTG